MDNEIKDFLSEYDDEVICSFIIGSYVHSNNFNDIDIVVISKNAFYQKHKEIENKELKATFLPEKMLEEDLKNDTYGSFVYGRFLNPIKVIKNSEYVLEYQKKAITRELKYHENIVREEDMNKKILKDFILNRGLYFSKYLKNLDIIEKSNKNIEYFCDNVINIYRNYICEKQVYTRSSENIFNYWKTRFLVKDMPLNLNDIIKLYSFKLNSNNIIEGDCK